MTRRRLETDRTRSSRSGALTLAVFGATAIVLAACSGDTMSPALSVTTCSIPLERFTDGGFDRSLIPALKNPRVALRGTPDVAYINFADLVIGVEFNNQPLAIPLKLLWWHEVADFEVAGERLTATYSPLTGSSLVFDPAAVGAGDFFVSSYVLDSNLVMEDSTGTLWPQMGPNASCGPRDGATLTRVPYQQMTFGSWFSIHLDTWTVSSATGHDFLYTLYPYGDYRTATNPTLRYPISGSFDPRRPPKERVIGVPSGTGGVAFSIPALAQLARADQAGLFPVWVWAANAEAGGEPVVAFWNSFVGGASVFRSIVDGQRLTFEVVDGTRRDIETGSVWNFTGTAVSGPLEGAELGTIPEAYVAFWFAWAQFQPDTDVWEPPIPVSIVPDQSVVELPPGPIDWSLASR